MMTPFFGSKTRCDRTSVLSQAPALEAGVVDFFPRFLHPPVPNKPDLYKTAVPPAIQGLRHAARWGA